MVVMITVAFVVPANVVIAGTDVAIAVTSTKTKFAFDRMECDMIGMEIIPANGRRKDKNKNEDSVIMVVYS
jgi:hypothetical protein